jgi:hypothetical protein
MTLDDPESGPLTMERDLGTVWRRVGEFLEPCGFVGDPDNCPPGLERHWEYLLREWNDSAGGGHEPEANWSYYERLSVARMN